MRQILALATTIAVSGHAMADRYGIDEAMDGGSESFSDMVWGALIVGAIYFAWKKFFK